MRLLNNNEIMTISGGELYIDIGFVYPPAIYYPSVIEVYEIETYDVVEVTTYYDPYIGYYDVYDTITYCNTYPIYYY